MSSNITVEPQTQGRQIIYEFGARIAKASEPRITDQIQKARRMYNSIIAVMRDIHDEMQKFVLERAGQEAKALQTQVEALNLAFAQAKAATCKANNDETEMKRFAEERRNTRKMLYPLLNETRKAHRTEMVEKFYSRIGNNSRCETYQLRNAAVQDGLGSSTANQILDNALKAWQTSMKQGHPPRFSVGVEKVRDTLTIQFTMVGGALAEDIVLGKRKDVIIEFPKDGFRKRSYTPFLFRLGPATDGTYAEGTVQMDRHFPEGAHVALARLVRIRVGMKFQYKLQFLLSLAEAVKVETAQRRKPFVAVHFGWSFDEQGRRLAGISDNGDVLDARLLQLPANIEKDLNRSAAIQSKRDAARNGIVAQLKEDLVLPTGSPSAGPSLPTASLPECLEERDALTELWGKLKKLPAQHISATRLHFLASLLMKQDVMPKWFEAWRKDDRLQWQAQVSLARRARNRRRHFYQVFALDIARQYEAVLLEMPDLKKAALKLDEKTGEKTDFAKKARAGRAVAALYELESAMKWAACKAGSAVLKMQGEHTADTCAVCGGLGLADGESGGSLGPAGGKLLRVNEEDGQVLYCADCGSTLDRKKNGAANAWRFAEKDLESLVTSYWETVLDRQNKAGERKAEKSAKMALGRKAAAEARKSDAE